MLENNYVLVEMDLDININLSHNYHVKYPPYVLILNKNGNVLKRVDGDTDADTFLNLATQVRDRIKVE